ncbi:bifunctional DNA-binding transcriptional regulator/O6-methylguanine-DNA methyltransferase Ada [Erythrobacter sp. HKB08]|uniref:bifunctional DNA-binding transcriptional regulator/O6-methylguanine-DNA methyltransferase Ada n=1 Tax=Erythrobacter sp. HKB08 TaxID=2502843 RepID=UPI001008A010|nr:bifunctional DNA-binding transcriptional regulator/O6-methylguanine-DNA methyltransferase Ada [Erythrobacter sp. HKB08]
MTDTANPLTDDQRWQIALAKDRRFDGVFVTGVHSTGIYCRPSCPARAPKRENVRFYADCDAAEAAGLRACKRCAPDQQSREECAVRDALALLQRSEEGVSLDKLAALTGYSAAHFQRVFKRAVGLSPAAYQRALRRERAGKALSKGESVAGAIYEAGYSAPSRFYDQRKDQGMSASAWSKGGAGVTIHWAVVDTSIGAMLVAATEKGVCRLSFDEDEAELRARFPNAELVEGGEAFSSLLQRVVDAVEQPGTGQDIPLDVKGTAFQEAVWQALREIPAGETRSYAQLAAAVGKPKATRAAGSANGANNVAVLIPCHRVVRSDGSIGGYAYGSDIKAELLRRERAKAD